MIRTELITFFTNAIKDAQKKGALPAFALPEIVVDHPENLTHGDYTTNVALILGQRLKKNPREVAQKIIESLNRRINETSPQPSPTRRGRIEMIIHHIEIAGPGFLNIWLKEEWLRSTLVAILKAKKRGRISHEGKGKTVIVEYSSPNIAKPMGIQHLRSTIIGQALANIYDTLGYRVIRDNHLGDFGTQFGKLIVAYRLWSKKKANALTIDDLLKLYIRFHEEAKKDATLEVRAREETKKLQKKERTHTALWKHFVRVSMREFNRIYKRLGIRFDTVLGESFYESFLADIVAEATKKGIATVSDGATVIRMPEVSKDPYIIQKSDGAYLYSTTDLATIRYREKKWHPDRVLYVVANQQALHFSQLFHAATLLQYAGSEKLVHVKFGMVLGKDGKKLATREGKVIALEEVMDEAVARARKLLEEQIANSKSQIKTEAEKARVAEVVGIGALKYNDLSQHRQTDIVVDWEKMLSFHGNSAPYLQYVVARIRSIIKKAKRLSSFVQIPLIHPFSKGGGRGISVRDMTEHERTILRLLHRFPEIIHDAAEKNEPHHIAAYLFQLASVFHHFYEHVPVLKAPKEERAFRLTLLRAVQQTITQGLALLGIRAPTRM